MMSSFSRLPHAIVVLCAVLLMLLQASVSVHAAADTITLISPSASGLILESDSRTVFVAEVISTANPSTVIAGSGSTITVKQGSVTLCSYKFPGTLPATCTSASPYTCYVECSSGPVSASNGGSFTVTSDDVAVTQATATLSVVSASVAYSVADVSSPQNLLYTEAGVSTTFYGHLSTSAPKANLLNQVFSLTISTVDPTTTGTTSTGTTVDVVCSKALNPTTQCFETASTDCYVTCTYTFPAAVVGSTFYVTPIFAGYDGGGTAANAVDPSFGTSATVTVINTAAATSTITLYPPALVSTGQYGVFYAKISSSSGSASPAANGFFTVYNTNTAYPEVVCSSSTVLPSSACVTSGSSVDCWVTCGTGHQWQATGTFSVTATYSGNNQVQTSVAGASVTVGDTAASTNTPDIGGVGIFSSSAPGHIASGVATTLMIVISANNQIGFTGQVGIFVDGVPISGPTTLATANCIPGQSVCEVFISYTFPTLSSSTPVNHNVDAVFFGDASTVTGSYKGLVASTSRTVFTVTPLQTTTSTVKVFGPSQVTQNDYTPLYAVVESVVDPTIPSPTYADGGYVTVWDNAAAPNILCSSIVLDPTQNCVTLTSPAKVVCTIECLVNSNSNWIQNLGTYTLSAAYSGSSSVQSSFSSSAATVTIGTFQPTTIAFTNAPTSALQNQVTNFIVTVSSASITTTTGTVNLVIDGFPYTSSIAGSGAATIGTITGPVCASNVCTFTVPVTFTVLGSHTVSPMFSGDSTYDQASFTSMDSFNQAQLIPITVTVNAGTPPAMVFASPVKAASGFLILSVTVSSASDPSTVGTATPSVTFSDTTGTLCTTSTFTGCTTVSGTTTCTASCTATRAVAGTLLTASYSGNDSNGASSTTFALYSLPTTFFIFGKIVPAVV